MPAYIIGQVTINDPVEYEKYLSNFMPIFLSFSGRVVVASEDTEVIEGHWARTKTIVLEFPTRDHARRWYDSEEYQKIVEHRFKSASANLVLANGFEE
jgi:uncharacterized protein (DUF1330 family)